MIFIFFSLFVYCLYTCVNFVCQFLCLLSSWVHEMLVVSRIIRHKIKKVDLLDTRLKG